jgi:transcriptional regulator NrdR family protein
MPPRDPQAQNFTAFDIECPKCRGVLSRCFDSRYDKVMDVRKRRRECEQCKHRFTTVERLLEEKEAAVRPSHRNIGTMLKTLRLKAARTQEQMADRMAVSLKVVQTAETGQTAWTVEKIEKYLQAL